MTPVVHCQLHPIRPSDHDELREVRTRWFGEEGVEVVVDTEDGRVVSNWRTGLKP